MSIFNSELKSHNVRFFILDTGRTKHKDIDFEIYTWNKKKYNLVQQGDVFIYRKPQKASENGKFYFFGAGKIESISEVFSGDVNFQQTGDLQALISKSVLFDKHIYQDQIHPSELNDTRKQKDNSWNHFFNNYGMNQIRKEDFLFLFNKGVSKTVKVDLKTNDLRVMVHKRRIKQNYEVKDSEATIKTRGKYQKIFREDIILPNYDYKCAITGIKTLSVLKAAHILRWADNQKERLNPQNGICLSALADICFEKGLLTIDKNYKVKLSEKVKSDPNLLKELKKYDGKKINLPILKENKPSKKFLSEHANKMIG